MKNSPLRYIFASIFMLKLKKLDETFNSNR